MKLKIGDKVAIIDDTVEGIVKKITNNQVVFETEDGFCFEVTKKEVVIINQDQADISKFVNVNNTDFNSKLNETQKKSKSAFKTDAKDKIPVMEVDLHINQLTNSTRKMDNYDMLTLQLDTAKHKLEFAIRKRIPKIVFIHGVGEGVLKSELEFLLKKYHVKYYDASYQKYGLGATEVYIYQNVR